MKGLIKLILLIAIIGFALFDYRLFSFEYQISKTSFDEEKNILEAIQAIAGIEKIEYYKNPFSSTADDAYKVYIATSDEAYLLNASKENIAAFETLGLFSSKFKPTKISPIPFYVEIVVGLIVLFIPVGRRKE